MYTTIDLCAGIGGIRRGFELTKKFKNVLSAEIDKYACQTYEHLYQDDPYNDLTTDKFKKRVKELNYDVLLAGFPCQSFSRAGLQQGFEDSKNGIILVHILQIIELSRPKAIFLENVDNLVFHNKGDTFQSIIEYIEETLDYKIIGVNKDLKYEGKDFIRNSKDFGVPQNRPRTYIMGFDRKYFKDKVNNLKNTLPNEGAYVNYKNIYDILEQEVPLRFYLSEGYLNTLKRHKKNQKKKGNNFGYKILNEKDVENPIANTLLATGGSGKERNLIYDPREGVAGQIVRYKKSPINKECIRTLTPTEWGKLQGFINYAFLDEHGNDHFSFPDSISVTQQYKLFGNSVTIPVIQVMADFMIECFATLGY